MFTAAQAAQKDERCAQHAKGKFTAAQAAQKMERAEQTGHS